jgi:hypothetical protein
LPPTKRKQKLVPLLAFAPVLALAQATTPGNAESKGKSVASVVQSTVVKKRLDNRSMADIAVFKSRLFVSFLEQCDDTDKTEGVLPSPRISCRMIRKSEEDYLRKLPCRQIDAAQVERFFQGFGVGRA